MPICIMGAKWRPISYPTRPTRLKITALNDEKRTINGKASVKHRPHNGRAKHLRDARKSQLLSAVKFMRTQESRNTLHIRVKVKHKQTNTSK